MRASLWIVVFAACSGTPKNPENSGATKPLTPKEIATVASPAIVRIEVGPGDKLEGTGTGFILDKGGLIATNFHVIKGQKQIRVKLYGGEMYDVTAIAGIDRGRDLALLKIAPAKALPTLRLGDSDKMSAGDQVVAIGNPLGVFEHTVSSGLVSQVRPVCTADMVERDKPKRERFEELSAKTTRREDEDLELVQLAQTACLQELKLLQISAPISQGSSGGPLFNQAGEVVGVTTLIVTEGQNINLAIPGNYLKPVVAQRVAISLEEFAAKTREKGGGGDPRDGCGGQALVRDVPDHPVGVLDGCNRDQITELVVRISETIELGAPLYNQGNFDACFRIYENTSTKFEREGGCKGVKKAFTDGLKRVTTMPCSKLKAWALRDTFDGLLGAVEKWAATNGPLKPTPKK